MLVPPPFEALIAPKPGRARRIGQQSTALQTIAVQINLPQSSKLSKKEAPRLYIHAGGDTVIEKVNMSRRSGDRFPLLRRFKTGGLESSGGGPGTVIHLRWMDYSYPTTAGLPVGRQVGAFRVATVSNPTVECCGACGAFVARLAARGVVVLCESSSNLDML